MILIFTLEFCAWVGYIYQMIFIIIQFAFFLWHRVQNFFGLIMNLDLIIFCFMMFVNRLVLVVVKITCVFKVGINNLLESIF